MIALILAAGIASRLRPLTDNSPKCLLKLGKKTILERTLDNLQRNNIKEYVIVTGYLENQIKEYINQNYPSLKVTYIHNDAYDSTNNIYSLWLAKDCIRNRDILLLDSDIIFDHRIVKLLFDSGEGNYLAVRSDHDLGEEEMKVALTSDNLITEISKKMDPLSAAGESIGIERFRSDFINVLFDKLKDRVITNGRVNDFYEAAFQDAINDGQNLYAVNVGDYKCIEIDTTEDIKHAEELISKYIDV